MSDTVLPMDSGLKPKQSRSRAMLWAAFALASLATIFDAVSSWQIIELNPIAIEGNPIWNSIAESIGFGGAMVLRALSGVALLAILLLVALRGKQGRVRRIGAIGLYFSATVLSILALYHLVFRLLYG